jgi:1,4-dihydroxy-2-naphthoate octaprenyltransferase
MLGRRGTVILYLALVALVYAVVVVQWLAGWAPLLSLAVLVSLPIAIASSRSVIAAPDDREVMGTAVMRSAKLESLFGLLYILSFVAAALTGL